jgi:hypothetical protein
MQMQCANVATATLEKASATRSLVASACAQSPSGIEQIEVARCIDTLIVNRGIEQVKVHQG